MSADESVLARWVRRKRAAAARVRRQPQPKDTGDGAASETAAASPQPGETQSHVASVSLPPIETISAGSDIRPFLAVGVPADLTRAALRRAWSADPAIRDFIGLSENSWDFNAPGGVPGFGSLAMESARRLLARVTEDSDALSRRRSAIELSADDQTPAPVSEAGQRDPDPVTDQMKFVRDTDADHGNPVPPGRKTNIAVQHERGERESSPPLSRRRHGGALPG